jgi:hypothetical protein
MFLSHASSLFGVACVLNSAASDAAKIDTENRFLLINDENLKHRMMSTIESRDCHHIKLVKNLFCQDFVFTIKQELQTLGQHISYILDQKYFRGKLSKKNHFLPPYHVKKVLRIRTF